MVVSDVIATRFPYESLFLYQFYPDFGNGVICPRNWNKTSTHPVIYKCWRASKRTNKQTNERSNWSTDERTNERTKWGNYERTNERMNERTNERPTEVKKVRTNERTNEERTNTLGGRIEDIIINFTSQNHAIITNLRPANKERKENEGLWLVN